ncbi:uncharacterized protein FYW47_004597 [Aplochiton taeniatus]
MARTLLGHTSALNHKEGMADVNEDVTGTTSDDDSSNAQRRKREFTPNEQKDDSYWAKRNKNNEAARRSREKRRANDMVLETRVLGLLEENARLKAELLALKYRFGLVKDVCGVSDLPLTTPSSNHLAPAAPHYCQPHIENTSYPHTISHQHHPYHHSYPPQHATLYRSRGALAPPGRDVAGLSEDSGLSTPGSSSMGSPVFSESGLSERSRPSPRGLKQQGCESHHSLEDEGMYRWRQEIGEGMKSLPHKLRFKAPNSVSERGEGPSSLIGKPGNNVATVRPHIHQQNQEARFERGVGQVWPEEECHSGLEQQYHCPSSEDYNPLTPQNTTDSQYMTENSNLRSQISSLSEEVAQIKKLFSQQLLSKLTLNQPYSLLLPP